MDIRIDDRHHQLLLNSLLNYYRCHPGDTVVEIGAGSGRYTEFMLEYGLKVIAVEPDDVMATKFEQRLSAYDNFVLHRGRERMDSDIPFDKAAFS